MEKTFREKKNLKIICKVLIESFSEKFHYELNSNVYSSLLNVTKLPLWYWKYFSSSYVSRAQNIIFQTIFWNHDLKLSLRLIFKLYEFKFCFFLLFFTNLSSNSLTSEKDINVWSIYR